MLKRSSFIASFIFSSVTVLFVSRISDGLANLLFVFLRKGAHFTI